ncbi:hypothetical protein F4777DRAFT_434450 [Nemania sp. FL0916]|nr:hypothetical protein F4777DRAFT_434450 [Nemania sp. FL0916]
MANNPARNEDSARAVQHTYLDQSDLTPRLPTQRPVINVPIDLGYSLQRFVNSHAHVEDRLLRPLQYFATTTPLTEDQSRARMAAIIAAAANAKPSAPTRD